MFNRSLNYLRVTFAVVATTYVALVVFTMYLASTQMTLSSSIGDTEAAIGRLEASYYTSVTTIDSTDPAALGFILPTHKQYAKAETGPVLTRAGI